MTNDTNFATPPNGKLTNGTNEYVKGSKGFEDELEPLSVNDRVTIGFRDLSYSVKPYAIFEKKHILNKLNGEFRCGELSFIMGASGSGKSTLMNVLSRFKRGDVSGQIIINDHAIHIDKFDSHKRIIYITQDIKLHLLLTVYESMNLAARFLLPSKTTQVQRDRKIEKILRKFSLHQKSNTIVENLSGGEKRRLDIAVELLQDPAVLFLDEPISNLDYYSARQCLRILKSIASQGRTVICTMHQPSDAFLQMCDQLYCLSGGHCIYQGSPHSLADFLSENFEVPLFHSPVDLLIEISEMDGKKYQSVLVQSCDNSLRDQLRPVACYKEETRRKVYATCFPHQCMVLYRRIITMLLRDRGLSVTRLLVHIVIGLSVGWLYSKSGNDIGLIQDNFNYLYYTVIFTMFTSFSTMTITVPLQVAILDKEYFNNWYSVKAYFFATSVADLPVLLMSIFLFVSITYLMSGQPLELFRFVLLFNVVALSSLVSQSIGILCGSFLNLTHAVILGPLAIAPFVMYSGFFLRIPDTPPYFRWIYHVSYLKYALEGAIHAVFGYNREPMPCYQDYCHYHSPQAFMHDVGFGSASYMYCCGFLASLFLALRLLIYVILVARMRLSRLY